MSPWPPPTVPLPEAPHHKTATFDVRARHQEVRAGFWRACGGATALTFVVVVAGLFVIAETTEPDPDSDVNSLVYVFWLMVAPLMLGPLFTWALATFAWRSMTGPSRAARVCISIALLAVPAMIVPAVIIAMFWGGADDFQVRLVGGLVVACGLVGVLLTGRVIRARDALIALGILAIVGVVGFQYAAGTTDDRYEADIREELEPTAVPFAWPAPSSGWTAESWFADQRYDPYGEPGDEERWVAHLHLIGPRPPEVTLAMWDASADWYCADIPCITTDITVDATQVLRYRGLDGWEHEVLPRGDQVWVLAHIDPLPDATLEQIFAGLQPVTVDEWAESVAPLQRT